jgi:D-inositol-3-phosphate glycosyltransferase
MNDARDYLDYPQDRNMLLFVGRIEPLKAVDSILEALHLTRQQNPSLLDNTDLFIVGGDPNDKTDYDMQQLQRLSRHLKLDGVVQFAGAKTQTELAYYYAAASAVIMPSEYESFGMVALEAMATGTPVIATKVGGLAYLVKDGETGFLVPSRSPSDLSDRITDLLLNPELRDTLGQNAARLSHSYAWSAIADRLLETFTELMPKTRRGAY